MRGWVLFLGLSFTTVSWAAGLGRLIEPGGIVAALAEVPGSQGPTFLFPHLPLDHPGWVTFPSGTLVSEVVLTSARGRTEMEFPRFLAPHVRVAVQVPPDILSLEIRGRWVGSPDLVLTGGRPDRPGQVWITRGPSDLQIRIPRWTAAPGFVPFLDLTRTGPDPWTVTVRAGESVRTFAIDAPVTRWTYFPRAWDLDPDEIEVKGPGLRPVEVRVRALGPEDPLPADPPTILAWAPATWRNSRREWFRWEGTSVLVLVTDKYKTLDDYLSRLAFFVEKTGTRGKLVPDDQLEYLHGWNAHDYAAPDLARFYNQAAQSRFPLNTDELELRNWLVRSGILVPQGPGSWIPGTGALVGITHAAPPALRSVLFVHEGFHGLYYTNPEFRTGVKDVWETLPEPARQTFRAFLARSSYDPSDEPLMYNEFQAYTLQRPSPEWVPFYRDRVKAGLWLTDLLSAARSIENLAFRLYGRKAGAVSQVREF